MSINSEPVDIVDYIPETVSLDIKHKIIKEIANYLKPTSRWSLARKKDEKWLYDNYETMPAGEIPLRHLTIHGLIIRVMCRYFKIIVKDKNIYSVLERNLVSINWVNVDFTQPLSVMVEQLAIGCLTVDLDNEVSKDLQPFIVIPLVMGRSEPKSVVKATTDDAVIFLKTKLKLTKYKVIAKVKNIDGTFNYEETVMPGKLYDTIGTISVLNTDTKLLNVLKIPLTASGKYKVKLKIVDYDGNVCKKKKFYFDVVSSSDY